MNNQTTKDGNNHGSGIGSKIGGFLRKLYHFRLKVYRKGQPVVNVSSLFSLACLLYAPFLTLGGIAVSLLLGYQIRFENETDDGELEETIRKAAQTVKKGAVNAADSLRKEFNKVRTESHSAVPAEASGKPAEKPETEPAIPSNEELLQELRTRAQETEESNPAATTFHSAYAASAGSVPVLQISGNEPEAAADSSHQTAQRNP